MELSPQKDIYYIDTVSPLDYFIDTVTPSAIQLNKEKIMSIELDGPLYLGSNSMQQQVDQNTADIEDLKSDVASIEDDIGSLDNLATSDKSSIVNAINETLSVLDPTQTADYIKNSKGLESGEISTNASILPWVEEMSHSTFDLSKFTVVGSPTITSDGIASGFGDSNYVTAPTITLGNNFKLYLPFTLPNTISATQIYRMQKDGAFRFLLTIGSGLNVYFNFQDDNGVNSGNLNILDSNEGVAGDSYIAVIELKNGTLTYGYIHNGVYTSKGTPVTTALNFTTAINNFLIGRGGSEGYNGSIDLKQFSITVEGVEVFSGNKTGVDTIKSDDYTVVGTPTISADGVASGFSSGNYINTRLTFNPSESVEYICGFKTGNDVSSSTSQVIWRLYNNLTGNWETNAVRIQSGDIKIQVKDGYSIGWACQTNTKYLVKMKFTLTATYYTIYDENMQVLVNNTYTTNPIMMKANNSLLTFGYSVGQGETEVGGYLTNGSIDLNAFKVYVDGDLVYQPCLKIPYTESKTGSKIVDAVYRSRVNDMAEQFGYAPYYTLGDTDFTLPKGELYGMVNKVVPTLIAPDYSKPVSLTYSSGLVMDNDGWLEVQIQSSEATANPYVSINSSIICRTSVNSNGDLNRDTAMMVVRKGDIITSGGYSADTAIVLTYYPFKV